MAHIKKFVIIAAVLSLWLKLTQNQNYTSVSPLWLTSSYMRAGSQDVIASLTGASVDPTYTFTFSSPLPGVPNLAYGIRRYRGADTIREQIFQIRKLSLDAKSFKVQVDIVGSTNIYTLNVPYLAVDPTFPHHLNSFDNVPINYGGTLTNITSKSMSTTYYSNTINYTQQTVGRSYTSFAYPLESNKILLYITSISIVATGWDIIWGYYPVDLNVSSRIVSNTTYSLSVSLSVYVAIAKLQFSMIVFNADDVESSKKYVIVYDIWETTDLGGFIEVPSAFVDNFILGLTDFSTMDGKCVISYQWSFANVSGKYGVQLAVSQPVTAAYDCALSRIKSTIFYMKTWQCPQANPYFNLTTNLCQNGCGTYFFPNSSVYQCQNCEWACAKCNNATFCTECDSLNDFRTLANISGKATCVCRPGYYQDPLNSTNTKCLSCIPNCLTCNSSTVCEVCDGVSGYILTTDKKCKKCGYGCLSCNEVPYTCYQCVTGMIFDSVQQKCVCLSGTYPSNSSVTCLACSPACGACTGPSSSECTNCSTNSPLPFYNSTTHQCQSTCGEYFFEDWPIFSCSSCPVGCNQCSSASNCKTCDLQTNKRNLTTINGVSSCPCIQGYYQDTNNTKNNVCLQCNISNCLACNSSTVCTLCNDLTGYVLNTTNQCKYCGYGCLSCNSTPYVCLQCKTGMVYDSSEQKCVCLAGTYPSNVTVGCLPCHQTCGACTGPSNSQCTNCSTNSPTPFYNSTTLQCQSTCGEYFFQDWLIFNCSSCPVGCNKCSSSSNCTTCDSNTNKRSLVTSANGQSSCRCIQGYYQDTNNTKNNVCIQCNISNCQACNSSTICTLCRNLLPGYSLSSTGRCVTNCGYGCLTCSQRSSSCITCSSGFVLNSTSKCNCLNGTFPSTTDVSCIACHPKCKTCTGPSEFNCTSCKTTNTTSPYFNSTTSSCQEGCGLYFFENQTALECQKCNFNCKDCTTSPQCSECDLQNHFRKLISRSGQKTCSCIVGYYQDPQNATNPVCNKCIDNCLTCSNNSTCDACNSANGFILSSNKTCIACGFGCVSCSQAKLQCTRCRAEFDLDPSTKQCLCPNGTVKAVNSVTCTSCHPTCKSCNGPTQYECTSCSSDQNRISLKQSNNLTQCICDPFAYIESPDGSLNCVKKTNESCNYGFIYIKEKKSCVQICGDGKNFGMFQCDDGNLVDGDGCSKTCQIQQDFDCKTVDGAETCYYVGVVNIIKAKAYKYPFSNHLLIQCKLEPIKKFFYTLDWKSGIVLVGPKMQVIDSWMEEEWLNINTTYFEDLTGKTLTIKYSSGLAKNKTIRSTGRTLFDSVFDFDITLRDYELPIVPANNIKPTYFEDNTYETVKIVQSSLFITAICTIVMILAAFGLKTVFPFWQLIFALQTVFLSLGVINYMNPLLTGLTEFSVVKGLRSTKIYFESLVSPNTVIEYNIASLGYVSSFFGNMNIMMFIWFALILASGALFLMSKKDLTMGFPFQFCKRTLMLLVLFSLMGYTFSVGLITSAYPFELTVAAVCGVIILGQLYNLLKHMKRYYHFDRTFDLSNKKVKYIVAMVVSIRVAQALVISLFRTNTFVAASIILGAQIFLTVGFVIFRPYTRTLFNILNILGQLAVTAFLSIDLIINLNFITVMQTQNLLSLVQISLNFLIVLLMAGCFVYSIVIDFCVKEKNLTPLKFDEDLEKTDSFKQYKNSSKVSNEKFNIKIEDMNQYDNSHIFINERNNKHLIVSK